VLKSPASKDLFLKLKSSKSVGPMNVVIRNKESFDILYMSLREASHLLRWPYSCILSSKRCHLMSSALNAMNLRAVWTLVAIGFY